MARRRGAGVGDLREHHGIIAAASERPHLRIYEGTVGIYIPTMAFAIIAQGVSKEQCPTMGVRILYNNSRGGVGMSSSSGIDSRCGYSR